jgi:hypothetical protein
MKIKPLPCPFCGRIPKFHHIAASLAAPEIAGAFWSLSCDHKKEACPGNPTAFGDTKSLARDEWNTRVPSDLSQSPIKPDDKPPFIARCGELLMLVDDLDGSLSESLIVLRGVILEGHHYNDRGDYGIGDRVNIGPITDYWRRISLGTNPQLNFA